ncbi:MAG: DUF1778 domain-containing protein [Geminicoccaceae bacterium]|nr:DUF1778 domain-containing protein [Geminicoccaceae bacterium]
MGSGSVGTKDTERPGRQERLGFRVDEETKALIERAAAAERRKLTDFCVAALTAAARRTLAEHETLVISQRDRAAFFDVLVDPPAPNERLERAFRAHRERIGS